jgi:acetyltransferase-like isoleucine patch superfamily enzyme
MDEVIRGAVVLGKNPVVEKGVVLCHRPGRKISNERVVIGDNAVIRSNTVIYSGVTAGENFETGHNVVVREENTIGDNCSIWSNSFVDYGCEIGSNVKIHCSVYVAQFTVIEDDVFLAPGVMIANDIHPGCEFSKKCMRGPIIKKGAQIGVNATVLPFVTIGERCIVGAGSVVTRDVPPGTVVLGNPARVVKSIDEVICSTGFTDKPYKIEGKS